MLSIPRSKFVDMAISDPYISAKKSFVFSDRDVGPFLLPQMMERFEIRLSSRIVVENIFAPVSTDTLQR